MEKTDGLPTEEGKKTDAAHPTAGIGLCWTTPLSCYTCNEYREDEQRIEDESREEQEELVSTGHWGGLADSGSSLHPRRPRVANVGVRRCRTATASALGFDVVRAE